MYNHEVGNQVSCSDDHNTDKGIHNSLPDLRELCCIIRIDEHLVSLDHDDDEQEEGRQSHSPVDHIVYKPDLLGRKESGSDIPKVGIAADDITSLTVDGFDDIGGSEDHQDTDHISDDKFHTLLSACICILT